MTPARSSSLSSPSLSPPQPSLPQPSTPQPSPPQPSPPRLRRLCPSAGQAWWTATAAATARLAVQRPPQCAARQAVRRGDGDVLAASAATAMLAACASRAMRAVCACPAPPVRSGWRVELRWDEWRGGRRGERRSEWCGAVGQRGGLRAAPRPQRARQRTAVTHSQPRERLAGLPLAAYSPQAPWLYRCRQHHLAPARLARHS